MADTSSLRQAIDKIMGWPAGGEAGGAVKAAAPPATSIALANDVAALAPDPMIAELESLKASNAELAAQMGGTAAEAAAPAEDTLGKGYGLSYSYPNSGFGASTYKVAAQGATLDESGQYDPNEWITLTAENINDPWVQESMKGGLTNLQTNTANMAQTDETAGAYSAQNKAIGAWESLIADPSLLTPASTKSTVPTRSGSSSSSTLRNPGPKAPWQESMQYWKDLAAQTGK